MVLLYPLFERKMMKFVKFLPKRQLFYIYFKFPMQNNISLHRKQQKNNINHPKRIIFIAIFPKAKFDFFIDFPCGWVIKRQNKICSDNFFFGNSSFLTPQTHRFTNLVRNLCCQGCPTNAFSSGLRKYGSQTITEWPQKVTNFKL